MKKVFVYGTLKQGFGNHSLLAESKFLGQDTLEDHTLILPTAFPYMIEWRGGEVNGEVYEIDEQTSLSLDALEGYPSHYQKKTITTKTGFVADTYFLDPRAGPNISNRIARMLSILPTGPLWERKRTKEGE